MLFYLCKARGGCNVGSSSGHRLWLCVLSPRYLLDFYQFNHLRPSYSNRMRKHAHRAALTGWLSWCGRRIWHRYHLIIGEETVKPMPWTRATETMKHRGHYGRVRVLKCSEDSGVSILSWSIIWQCKQQNQYLRSLQRIICSKHWGKLHRWLGNAYAEMLTKCVFLAPMGTHACCLPYGSDSISTILSRYVL